MRTPTSPTRARRTSRERAEQEDTRIALFVPMQRSRVSDPVDPRQCRGHDEFRTRIIAQSTPCPLTSAIVAYGVPIRGARGPDDTSRIDLWPLAAMSDSHAL